MPMLHEEHPAAVSRAVRIVAAHCDCTCEEAMAMLAARAVIFDQTVETVAEAVVARTMRFR